MKASTKGINGLRKTILEFAIMLNMDISQIEEEINKMDKKTLIGKLNEMKSLLLKVENNRLLDIIIDNCKIYG